MPRTSNTILHLTQADVAYEHLACSEVSYTLAAQQYAVLQANAEVAC